MTRLTEQYDLFQKQLREFEPVLAKYGYVYVTSDYTNAKDLGMESAHFKYLNKSTGLEASVSFVISDINKDRIQVDFYMSDGKNASFYLTYFQQDHVSLPQIQTDLFVKNYSEDLQKFFTGLENAFENYLHDQIVGLSFQNHSSKILESFYSSSAVHDMQKQVIEDARNKRETNADKQSFWNRLGKLFKS